MSFMQLRGAQIQSGTVGNVHINSADPIQEANLSINWHNHTESLTDRKIVTPVQVNNVPLASGASMDITSYLTGNIAALSADSIEGIISDAPNNKVAIRALDDTVVYVTAGGTQYELYGRVTYTAGATPVWTMSYFYKDAAGVETAYTFAQAATPVSYVLFVPKRQNLVNMDEMVLAGYRFMVQDAVDAVTGSNVNQLAADLYGPNFSLTGNGVAKLSRSVIAEIQYQTSGVTNTTVRANAIIDEVIAARGSFSDLLGRFSDADNKINTVTTQSNADHTEVTNARTNAASTPVTYANLKARLDAIDSSINNVTNGGSSTQTEVTAARVTTVAQQTGAYITGADLTSRLSADFAEVVNRINTANTNLTTFENNLADATDAAKGAALVGVHSTKVTSATVFAALEELHDNAHGVTNPTVAASGIIDEVISARGSQANLSARLNVAVNADGTLKAGRQIHDHKKYVYQAVGGETSVSLPVGHTFQAGDDSLDVYVNGGLQAKGLNYTEITPATPDGTGSGVSFGSTTLVSGDVVTLKYYLNNAS